MPRSTIASPINSARSRSPAASRAPRRGACCFRPAARQCFARRAIDPKVPEWMAGKGRGWLTAEYNMLPASTSPRKRRDRDGKLDGRTTEIQRLIGRSLRAIVDLDALGERSILIDCDVLEADGGTRTASITGAFIALVDALATLPITSEESSRLWLRASSLAASPPSASASSKAKPLLDLDYSRRRLPPPSI